MTVIINKQEELEALIDKNNNIIIHDDLKINCDINIEANIDATNIDAFYIKAWDIDAKNIKADDIKAYDIEAYDIDAGDIKAWDIIAGDIKANNIEANDIKYYAFCITYESLKCKTIKGERKNSLHACLDQPIEYIK